jgi:hypothetical protein
MRRRLATLFVVALAAIASVAVGCGEEEELEVPEGEPLELGEIAYNVQVTRFLNPASPEDSTYLQGAAPLRPGEQYLGVFMEIENEGDEVAVVPYPFKIVDTRGTIFIQDELADENPFALQPGTPIEPDAEVPGVETAAANGPIEGSLILFRIDEAATEDRPLILRIPGPEGVGTIELDL